MMKEILERKTPNNLKRTECGMGWYWSSHTDHRSVRSVGWWGLGSWNNKKIKERTTALLPVLGAPVVIKIAQWFPGSQIWPVRVGAALRGTPPPVLGLLTGLPAPLKHHPHHLTLQRTWGRGSLSGRRLPTPRVSVTVVRVWQGKLKKWHKNFPSCCPGPASFNAPITIHKHRERVPPSDDASELTGESLT